MTKKVLEFPGERKLIDDLGAAHTKFLSMGEVLRGMAGSGAVSAREAEGITEIWTEASKANAYTRIYSEALPIAKNAGEGELAIYYEALQAVLRDAARDYNWATTEGKPAEPQLAADFAVALVDWQAGLDARFAVKTSAEADTVAPVSFLTEEEKAAVAKAIDLSRAAGGGRAAI